MASELKTNLITPASSTTVTIGESGDTISLGSGATASGFGGGKVLQCLQAINLDDTSTTSSTFIDVPSLTVTITPSATSSKILVSTSMNVGQISSTSGGAIRFVRGSTAIGIGNADGSRTQATWGSKQFYSNVSENEINVHFQFLDSPSTISPTTFKIQYRAVGSTFYTGRSASDTNDSNHHRTPTGQITVMEIGA